MCRKETGMGQFFALITIFVCIGNYAGAQMNHSTDSFVTREPVIFKMKPVTAKSFLLPTLLITTGALGTSGEFIISNPEIKEERDESFKTFHTSLDNYLQFAPIAAGYAMLINNKEHSFLIYTEKVVLTEVMATATVQATKRITNIKRPDGTPYSFPSGHTAQAFAGATLFCDEFAQHKPWLAATVYTSATTVGVLRVLNNRHWTSDIVAGAGFGILSAKASEWIVDAYNRNRHSKHNYTYQF